MEAADKPLCGAKRHQGTGTCRRAAGAGTDHLGFGQCHLHGGATPNGKKHGETLRQEYWERLVAMGDPALTGLLELVVTREPAAVRLGAIRDVLDRIGFGAKHVHEHTGPNGGPIPVEVRAAQLLERVKGLRPPATGKPATKATRKKASPTRKKASE